MRISKNLFPLLLIVILGIFVYSFQFLGTNVKVKTQVITAEAKKQALEKFYKEISTAEENQDWSKDYDFVPQSVRDNVTKDQYIAYSKNNNKFVSAKVNVKSIEVNGNTGTVNRTWIFCLKKECIGNDRKEESGTRSYTYIEGKWQVPDPKPSERSLKAVTYDYLNMSETEQKQFRDGYSYGSGDRDFAVNNYAVYLDKNQEKLVLLESWVEKTKAEKNRPVVNYQPPTIIQEAPTVNVEGYPTHCSSYTSGDYASTNCY